MKKKMRNIRSFAVLVGGLLSALTIVSSCVHAQNLSGWDLTFDDEFNGTQLDTNKWNTTYMWGGTDARTLTGNHELEVYWDNQFEETNGILRIRADKVDSQWGGTTWHYSSGLITTYTKFAQQYGYFEMRAKFPHGDGLWPAFWMLLDRQYWPPEVDILEILDSLEEQPHSGVIQTSSSNWGEFYPSFNSTLAYHLYGMEWDTNHVTFYLDGQETWQGPVATNMTEPMQMLANLAVGGSGTIPPDASTVFPAYMDIDYIRVWSRTDPSVPIPSTVGYDIGAVGIAGNTAFTTNGTATVSGAGLGYLVGNTNDSFQYAAQPEPGDVDYDYLAEVSTMSVTNGQAGVMIRATLDADSRYVAVYFSGSNCVLVSRTATGGSAVQIASASAVSNPVWLRLVRRGDAITAYQSADGIAWSYLGATTNDLSSSAMGPSVYAGVAVSSDSTSVSNLVSFGSLNKSAIEIIQDNNDATGVTINGSWTAATNQAGYYGANYIVSSTGASSVLFTPAIPTNATYDVYLRWTAFSGRSIHVPVTITYAGGSTNVTVDQQHNGGQWVWLGAFPFNTGTSGNVLISDTNTTGSVCVNAVRYVPGVAATPLVPTPPDTPTGLTGIATPDNNQITLSWNAAARATSYNVKRSTTSGGPYTNIANVLPNLPEYTDSNVVAGTEYYYVVSTVNGTSPENPAGQESPNSNESAGIPSIIIDNTNTADVAIIGTWTSSTSGYAYYGTNYLQDGDAGGGKSVTFSPDMPVGGLYKVYMRWTTGTNRASNVPIQIVDATGATNTVYVNEQLSYGVWWVYLGTFQFNAGTAGSVTISDTNANGYVIADAVEFVVKPESSSPPSTPTGLTATAGNAQVNLGWTAANGAASYNVRRSTTSGGPYTTIATGVISTSYTDTGLINGTTYYYVVSAVNSAGESANSVEAGAIPCATPAVPTILNATGGNAQVSLVWAASSGAATYTVKSANNSSGPYSQIASGLATTNYTDSGLASGTTYFYVVDAANACGPSADSAYRGAVTIPGPPTGLAAAAGNAQVTLTWGAPEGADSYNVKRSTTSGGPYTVLANLVATNYTDTNVVNGTTYYYVVSALNSSGESTNSAEVSAVPQQVAMIIKDNSDSTGIIIIGSWIVSTNIAGYYGSNYLYDGDPIGSGGKSVTFTPTITTAGIYNVYARWTANSNRATNAPIDVIYAGGTNTFYVNQQLNNGAWELLGTFQFNTGTNGNVTVRNGGASGYVVADAVEFQLNVSLPMAPTGLVATAGDAQVILNWNASSEATSYNIKRATVSGGPYAVLANIVATNYTDTGVTNGSTYYYVVSAVNGSGESANSSEVSTTPSAPTAPAAPTNLTASAGKKQITLVWTQSSSPNIVNNNVYRATVSGGPYTEVVSITATTSYTDSRLNTGTTYYYVITAVNSSGLESLYSNQAGATTR